jgi:hypothetical protein
MIIVTRNLPMMLKRKSPGRQFSERPATWTAAGLGHPVVFVGIPQQNAGLAAFSN